MREKRSKGDNDREGGSMPINRIAISIISSTPGAKSINPDASKDSILFPNQRERGVHTETKVDICLLGIDALRSNRNDLQPSVESI